MELMQFSEENSVSVPHNTQIGNNGLDNQSTSEDCNAPHQYKRYSAGSPVGNCSAAKIRRSEDVDTAVMDDPFKSMLCSRALEEPSQNLDEETKGKITTVSEIDTVAHIKATDDSNIHKDVETILAAEHRQFGLEVSSIVNRLRRLPTMLHAAVHRPH